MLAGRRPVLGRDISVGDGVILLPSNGLQAKEHSWPGALPPGLPTGLLSELPSGRHLGDALLDPTKLYAPYVRELLASPAVPKFRVG